MAVNYYIEEKQEKEKLQIQQLELKKQIEEQNTNIEEQNKSIEEQKQKTKDSITANVERLKDAYDNKLCRLAFYCGRQPGDPNRADILDEKILKINRGFVDADEQIGLDTEALQAGEELEDYIQENRKELDNVWVNSELGRIEWNRQIITKQIYILS